MLAKRFKIGIEKYPSRAIRPLLRTSSFSEIPAHREVGTEADNGWEAEGGRGVWVLYFREVSVFGA